MTAHTVFPLPLLAVVLLPLLLELLSSLPQPAKTTTLVTESTARAVSLDLIIYRTLLLKETSATLDRMVESVSVRDRIAAGHPVSRCIVRNGCNYFRNLIRSLR